jgi:DNA-binding IscR family transcriptional regulator
LFSTADKAIAEALKQTTLEDLVREREKRMGGDGLMFLYLKGDADIFQIRDIMK